MLIKNKNRRAFLFVEMTVSLTLLAMIIIALAVILRQTAKFNDFQLKRQRCAAAALAQLDSIAATNSPLPKDQFRQLWPNVSSTIEISKGTGQWQNLNLVTVTAAAPVPGRNVEIKLSRYMQRYPEN